ncbi:unnamed protein product [Mycetohabitans rhizoxinica HKI 454]|uniref:Uncharacterized protein n=1 Tax=Mycetohabitans rhizoxinica (strain DSM 19002 / CIP 109453 / HKI 454) TaxID=882378 RepID=E5ASE6_MYCRK|nr:unnamed protein product [Mycetohabitans rhizoxinica HKI 454]
MTTVQRRCHDEARPQHDAELGNGRVATRAFCWRCPNVKSAEPRYQQARISDADKCGKWRLIVSSHGWDGSLQIRQDGRGYMPPCSTAMSASAACCQRSAMRIGMSRTLPPAWHAKVNAQPRQPCDRDQLCTDACITVAAAAAASVAAAALGCHRGGGLCRGDVALSDRRCDR